MKNIVVTKKDKKVKIYIDNKKINYKDKYCILIGNIYNIDELYDSKNNFSIEEKLLELYDKYKEKLFYKLSGEYAIIFIKDNNVTLVRDRIGSKQLYYGYLDNTFICSNTLEYFINNYKQYLTIDKQILSNYLCYCYIQEPNTIFQNIYKVNSGNYIIYKNNKILCNQYYNIVEHYLNNKEKIKNIKLSKQQLEDKLFTAITSRCNNAQNIGIFLSAGIDSTLIATLAKKTNKNIHTYTIGFNEKERNEADKARKISKYLNLQYHEFYLDHDTAKHIVYLLPKIYSEPFADPSIIPTFFLHQHVSKDLDIILTGDGADQLYCGSNIYCKLNNYSYFKKNISVFLKKVIYQKKQYLKWYENNKKYTTLMFSDISPNDYCNISLFHGKRQIKYMMFEIKSFLANRLFSKVSFSAIYNNINISHPFIDNDFVDTTFKIKYKYKYYKKEKKYILKDLLYDKIPQELLNNKKNGFGIPLKKWIYNIYKEDIIKLSNSKILKRQGLFPVSKIEQEIEKLKNETLSQDECTIMFSYYMFQLWYQYYIEDLWKEDKN